MKAQAQVVFAVADFERGQQLVDSRTIPVRSWTSAAPIWTSRPQPRSPPMPPCAMPQLNLEWTEVRAPLGGRISDRKVDVGNLVAGGQGTATTLLTTIVRLDPIYFVFEASEADYLRYSRLAVSGGRASARNAPTPVEINLSDETDWPHRGVMNFVDNRLSSRAGTIRGRAIFDNHDLFLTPGTFGRARVFGGDVDALPDSRSGDQFGPGEQDCHDRRGGQEIVPKPVVLGPMSGGLRVVTSGLAASDEVVISGIANPFVRPGALVDPIAGEIETAAN